MQYIQKILTSLLILSSLCSPGFADIQNTGFERRELDVQASGATAKEALQHCEEAALEQIVFTLVQTEAEKKNYAAIRSELLAQRDKYVTRIKILGKGTDATGGRFYKVKFEIQVKALQEFLTQKKVILSSQGSWQH